MRARATVSSVLLGLALSGGFFIACGNAGPPAQPPPSGGGLAEAPTSAPTQEASSPADAAAPPPTPPGPANPPETAADCAGLPVATGKSGAKDPNGGLCMNNATTSADAGSSDRCQGMADVVKAHHPAFRCCYDLYSKANKNTGVHLVLNVSLAPDGTFKDAKLDKGRSSVSPPDLDACMTGVAKTLTYPKSPKGMETSFNYPFDFHPH